LPHAGSLFERVAIPTTEYLSDTGTFSNCDSSEVDREERDEKERLIQMKRNVVTSGIAWHVMQRPMMGAKESSRCGSCSAIECESQISWISMKRRNTKMLNQKNGIGKNTVIVLSLLTVLFWAGPSWAGQAGKATQLTNDQVTNLTANAKTAADHERLAQHFSAKADAYEAEAQEHEDQATQYRLTPNPDETKRPGTPRTAAHCYKTSAGLHKSAKNARQLSSKHAEMANDAPN
jgi:hypothetical protein